MARGPELELEPGFKKKGVGGGEWGGGRYLRVCGRASGDRADAALAGRAGVAPGALGARAAGRAGLADGSRQAWEGGRGLVVKASCRQSIDRQFEPRTRMAKCIGCGGIDPDRLEGEKTGGGGGGCGWERG